MFYAGQKVVCIDAGSDQWASWDGDAPIEGQIYTVRRVITAYDGQTDLQFYEIERAEMARTVLGPEAGYGVFRFRPVVEPKADIAVFKRMLQPELT